VTKEDNKPRQMQQDFLSALYLTENLAKALHFSHLHRLNIWVRTCLFLYPKQKWKRRSWAPVAHTCNLSYSGGRDQEDRSSKPIWANSLRDPIWKNPFTKKGWWSGSK
jgi:hypothetical protein